MRDMVRPRSLARILGEMASEERWWWVEQAGDPSAHEIRSPAETLALAIGLCGSRLPNLVGLSLGPFHPGFISDADLRMLGAAIESKMWGLPVNLSPDLPIEGMRAAEGLKDQETRNHAQIAIRRCESLTGTATEAAANGWSGGRLQGPWNRMLYAVDEIRDHGWAIPEALYLEALSRSENRLDLVDLFGYVLPQEDIDARFNTPTPFGLEVQERLSGLPVGG